MIEQQVLAFGEFTLKSGISSPYFFNLGKIDDAAGLVALGQAYAEAIDALGWQFDVLFGPAYKGIPIAVATATAMLVPGVNPGVAYNRKEAKSHGEGGRLVGASIEGKRVIVLDDVLTAGTAVREALSLISAGGGELCGVLVALDRQERQQQTAESGNDQTALEKLATELQVPVASIVRLEDVTRYLDSKPLHSEALGAVEKYMRANCLPTAADDN
jgi:orotate phosphoribosyltransferase